MLKRLHPLTTSSFLCVFLLVVSETQCTLVKASKDKDVTKHGNKEESYTLKKCQLFVPTETKTQCQTLRKPH